MNVPHLRVLQRQAVADGYEGLMWRRRGAKYQHGRRSPDLLKVKTWQDREFKIVDVQEGRGKFAGAAIFTCETDPPKNLRFNVTAPGDMEEKAKYLKRRGGWLTVKFFELSDDGVPLFPVGLAVRDYEGA